MRKFWALLRCRRGASAIEFAITAGPFLLFVLGVFEFGRLLWTREALQEAAMAGARCMGILQSSCTTSGAYNAAQTENYVKTIANQWSVPLVASNVTPNPNATCGGIGGFSQVSITYTFTSVVPHLITALVGGVNLSTAACFPNQS
jgi:Flp pilus assembly protein TadG